MHRVLLNLWAGAGVPGAFFAFVAVVVKAADGKPPFPGAMALWATMLAALLLFTGALIVARRVKQHRLAATLGYVVAMASVLAIGAVLVSIGAGDIG